MKSGIGGEVTYDWGHKGTSVTKQGPLEQTVAKCSRILVQIRISNELNKVTLGCKADQTAEIVR